MEEKNRPLWKKQFGRGDRRVSVCLWGFESGYRVSVENSFRQKNGVWKNSRIWLYEGELANVIMSLSYIYNSLQRELQMP